MDPYFFLRVAASSNKANQADQFVVRCAHNEWSAYLRRYANIMKNIMRKYVAILIVAFTSTGAFACSCYLGDIKQKYDEAVSVFIGQVKSVEFTGKRNDLGDKKTIVIFSVQKAWKNGKTEIILNTANNEVSCSGYWFKEKETYLIYAYEHEGNLDTYYCGGVMPKNEENEFINETTTLDKISEQAHNK